VVIALQNFVNKFIPYLQDADQIKAKVDEVEAQTGVASKAKALLVEAVLLAALMDEGADPAAVSSAVATETAYLSANQFGVGERDIQPTILAEAKKMLT